MFVGNRLARSACFPEISVPGELLWSWLTARTRFSRNQKWRATSFSWNEPQSVRWLNQEL